MKIHYAIILKLIKVTGFETNFSWSIVFKETASVADPDPGEVAGEGTN
jgi:hypothetical protein